MTFDDAYKRIYARHSAGCCLHIVLDDLNTDDECVWLCFETALAENHHDCVSAAEFLIGKNPGEREMHIAQARGDIT